MTMRDHMIRQLLQILLSWTASQPCCGRAHRSLTLRASCGLFERFVSRCVEQQSAVHSATHILQSNASLVVRHHLTSPDLDDLTRFLFSQSSVHMEVMPLSSGKSGSVSGEVCIKKYPRRESSDQVHTDCITLWAPESVLGANHEDRSEQCDTIQAGRCWAVLFR